jgi:hypothetical protein
MVSGPLVCSSAVEVTAVPFATAALAVATASEFQGVRDMTDRLSCGVQQHAFVCLTVCHHTLFSLYQCAAFQAASGGRHLVVWLLPLPPHLPVRSDLCNMNVACS